MVVAGDLFVEDGGSPALLPAVHWDHDHGDLSHLAPTDSHNLYYAAAGISDPYLQHAFAKLSTQLHHPAVVLGHSGYVEAVRCRGRHLNITFNEHEAFEYAKSSWPSVSSFLLVTYAIGCGASNDQRSFWLVDHVQTGDCDTCLTADIEKEVSIKDAMHEADVSWGTYNPSQTKARRGSCPSGFHSGQFRSRADSRSLRIRQESSDVPGCGPAPSPEIDGFPTATCNSPTFDQDLDDRLGYFDFGESQLDASLRAFAPGFQDNGPSDSQLAQRRRRSVGLVRRGFFDIFESIAKTVVNVVKEVFSEENAIAVAKTLLKVVAAVTPGISTIVAVAQVITVDEKINDTVTINLAPPGQIDSPWGQAKQLYNTSGSSSNGVVEGNLDVYCVRCGVDGSIHFSGRLEFQALEFQEANIAMNGNIEAGVAIGIDAKEAEADLGISLQGQVLAGANVSIPNFSANLDLVNQEKSFARGFKPQLKRIFEAKAQVAVHANFGLPISVGIGLIVPKLKFEETIKLTNKPSIQADMIYTASSTCDGLEEDNTCVNGIKYAMDFINDLYVNFFGKNKFNLYNVTIPIVAGRCIRLGGPGSCTSSTTDAPVPTDVFGDPLINPFQGPIYSEYLAANSFIGAAPLVAAVPTDASGNPLLPFNTIGAAVTGLPTAVVGDVQAMETDVFGNPYLDDSTYSVSEKDASAISPSFQDFSAAALANAQAQTETINATDFTNSTDSTFITIPDMDNEYALLANDDTGNLEIALVGEGSRFIAESGLVIGDSSRYFHFYPDVMAKYGVSRIRLSNESEIPLTTNFISLTPVNYNDNNETKNVYAAVDTLANYYFLATCNIQGQASKVFLVADEDEALEKLRDEQLRFTVTGGVVDVCYFISFTQPPSPDAIQPGAEILPFVEAAEANRTSGNNSTNSSPDNGDNVDNTTEGSDNGNTPGAQDTDMGDTQAGGGESNMNNSGSTDSTGNTDTNSGSTNNPGGPGNTDSSGNPDTSGETNISGNTDNVGNVDNADNTSTGGENTSMGNTGDTAEENTNAGNRGNTDTTSSGGDNTSTDDTGNNDGQTTSDDNTATEGQSTTSDNGSSTQDPSAQDPNSVDNQSETQSEVGSNAGDAVDSGNVEVDPGLVGDVRIGS
ncbi:MAG: hypothetical protein Q9169_006437 [Polycauliona sp. 2 TL-2023]